VKVYNRLPKYLRTFQWSTSKYTLAKFGPGLALGQAYKSLEVKSSARARMSKKLGLAWEDRPDQAKTRKIESPGPAQPGVQAQKSGLSPPQTASPN
jgi:hypothetical protein